MPENIKQFRANDKCDFWTAHLERWQQSGLSQRSYCREHHLKPHRFYYWRRRILPNAVDVSFLPVMLPMEPPKRSDAIRILMPNG